MFIAPSWAQKQRVADVGTMATLLVLANHADEDNVCFPGQSLLADITGQSVRQVRRQLAYLEALGLIVSERRNDGARRTSNRYRLQIGETVNVTRDDPKRTLLSGGQTPCQEDSGGRQEDSGGQAKRTVGVGQEDSTGRGTPSSNSQNYELPARTGSPDGRGVTPEGLRKRFIAGLYRAKQQHGVAVTGVVEKQFFNRHMRRLLESGVPGEDLVARMDTYLDYVSWWNQAITPWNDFVSNNTQTRLANHLSAAGNTPASEPVREVVRDYTGMSKDERFYWMRYDALPQFDKDAWDRAREQESA